MTDTAATILAFAISFGVLAGYGVGVFVRLRAERAKARTAASSGESPGRSKSAVVTEVKPESRVKAS